MLDVQLEEFQDRSESPLVDFTIDGYVDVDEDVLRGHSLSTYQGVRNVSFSGNFEYVLNGWSLTNVRNT